MGRGPHRSDSCHAVGSGEFGGYRSNPRVCCALCRLSMVLGSNDLCVLIVLKQKSRSQLQLARVADPRHECVGLPECRAAGVSLVLPSEIDGIERVEDLRECCEFALAAEGDELRQAQIHE